MKALHIAKYGRFPKLTDCSIPQLAANEVLVKMRYAPVNPSDINFFQGRYGMKKQGFPIVGFQGSGQIIKADNKTLQGRKVSVLADNENGTHATHIKSKINNLIIWPDETELSTVSTAWINPFSCLGLIQFIIQQKPQYIIISAARAQLSIMLMKMIKMNWPDINLIGLARSHHRVDQLKEHGLGKLLIIDQKLKQNLGNQLKEKTLFFDCIGGQLSGEIFNQLPESSMMICYGRLSGKPLAQVNLGQLYFRDKSIKGFWLNHWFKKNEQGGLESLKYQITHHFPSIFQQKIKKIIPLQNFEEAYHLSIKDQSQGKILLSMLD